MLKAYWQNAEEGIAVLSRDWTTPDTLPEFLIYPGKQKAKEITRVPLIEFAQRSGYFREGEDLTFIFEPKSAHLGQKINGERIYVSGSFNGWDEAINNPKWELKRQEVEGLSCYALTLPWEECYDVGEVHRFKFVTNAKDWLEVPVDAPNAVVEDNNRNYELRAMRTGHHMFYFKAPFKQDIPKAMELVCQKERCHIDYTPWLLNYKTDLPLGAIVEENETVFRLFAPRAIMAKVIFYEDLEYPDEQTCSMVKVDDCTWEYKHKGNLDGWYYYYQITGLNKDDFSHFSSNFKILDPYAKATVCASGPGIIVDFKKNPKPESSYQPPAWDDLIILEAHVRDLLAKDRIELTKDERLGFTGLSQWIHTDDNYIRQLGVNAVEFQPVQEFEYTKIEEYHWGYMPVNYFSPSSAYAEHPGRASQVKEFQNVVKAFHDRGIAVILDVVYNHVGDPNHLLYIDKQYYFETTEKGDLYNYSGCGNDLRARAPMAKRLIIDSLIHFMEVYGVDGFRFDLAELLGVDVLKDIEAALKKAKPSAILIAEPWSFRAHIAHMLRPTGFAFWNSAFREYFKQYVQGDGNHEGFRYFIKGSLDFLTRFPSQSVNYSESHDDRCWIDSITQNADHNGMNPTMLDQRRTHLMVAFLMMSLGIPMISEGQDFLKSKQGVNNTYQRGDLNALNFHRLIQFADTHDYFRRWIRFRLSDKGKVLRPGNVANLDTYFQFFHATEKSASAVIVNSDQSLGETQLFFAINPHADEVWLDIDGTDLATYTQIADHARFNDQGLHTGSLLWHAGKLHLPPNSCGLWVK
ncbi:MAG: glycoside hydrolase family 1 [Verrucomicrobia bacterium CG_4_10_14_3_um_filter_43_23]|nr:MAG: hypothetical protein AUJ82_04040 [Verrucomicrobia bacterium CG1_02_43_26]PIP58685.1 MAG: glycoside hydrolase family 1 [Verrucomicrobia bacterium CG22_combo_CG10-13_8_21_14_all_43_17]PIX58086.1 MAG: glycoside hydrolase family 1 [Verrucomicrobia bacterium CG_4_10_14_3_um_filter_43_23]PIY61181.1 MAG: glycoside hydrolase family 1 [Verrucomicrobia bacterium CG_4_10_14_0_8_um_filter_43_34]PJA43354.1 MAG: glycoside hydrolase family 1 [Verrucomicrobia bacterium CG_4_9_14_3_um_filter_43_20]